MTQKLNVIKININNFKQILTQKDGNFQNKTFHKFYSDIISPKSVDAFQAKGLLQF